MPSADIFRKTDKIELCAVGGFSVKTNSDTKIGFPGIPSSREYYVSVLTMLDAFPPMAKTLKFPRNMKS